MNKNKMGIEILMKIIEKKIETLDTIIIILPIIDDTSQIGL